MHLGVKTCSLFHFKLITETEAKFVCPFCWWLSEHPLNRGLKFELTEGKTCTENVLRGHQNEGGKGYSGYYHLNNMRPCLKRLLNGQNINTLKFFKGDKNDEFNGRTFLGFQWRRGLLRLRLCRIPQFDDDHSLGSDIEIQSSQVFIPIGICQMQCCSTFKLVFFLE